MICNFPPSTPQLPSTISHDDVTTLFHEFGHAMQLLLTDTRFQMVSGTRVAVSAHAPAHA